MLKDSLPATLPVITNLINSSFASNYFAQVVRMGSDLSDPLPLTVGVAHGSILGPVLFTLYVNNLLSVPKKCEAMGYIDDTKLL